MLTKRIIPCLDTRDGQVVKGINFANLRQLGSPADLAETYETQGADEIVILDISATLEGRKTALAAIREVRERISIPICVGGGITSESDARILLEAGADKVSINTAAIANPDLLAALSANFGRQCTIIAIDAAISKLENPKPQWEVLIKSGKERTGLNVIQWAQEAEQRGAGEILLTSWDRDGTRTGYDLDLLREVSSAVKIPVIASGGANNPEHLFDAIQNGADAVLAASIFHDGDYTVLDVKSFLKAKGVAVRI